MDIRKMYDLNTTARWRPIGNGTVRVKVQPWTNKRTRVAHERFQRKYGKLLRRNRLSDEVTHRELAKIVAETVLLDWEGVESDGEPVPFSPETAQSLLDELEPLTMEIMEVSIDLGNERVEEVKDVADAGKSAPPPK